MIKLDRGQTRGTAAIIVNHSPLPSSFLTLAWPPSFGMKEIRTAPTHRRLKLSYSFTAVPPLSRSDPAFFPLRFYARLMEAKLRRSTTPPVVRQLQKHEHERVARLPRSIDQVVSLSSGIGNGGVLAVEERSIIFME